MFCTRSASITPNVNVPEGRLHSWRLDVIKDVVKDQMTYLDLGEGSSPVIEHIQTLETPLNKQNIPMHD